jgi:hypothetical protein
MEFMNANETDILFDLRNESVLKRDSRELLFNDIEMTSMITRNLFFI